MQLSGSACSSHRNSASGYLPSGCSSRRTSDLSSLQDQSCAEEMWKLENAWNADDILFHLLCDSDNAVSVSKFWAGIKSAGILQKDPRLKETSEYIDALRKDGGFFTETDCNFKLDCETFKEVVAEDLSLIVKAFKSDFVIPEFPAFTSHIKTIYENCKGNTSGMPSKYSPQLARMDSSCWGVSLCTIDGQRYSIGNADVPFTLQGCSLPLNYALAVSDLGAAHVHQYVGQEPSGRNFNDLYLDHKNKPHNPMINAGAIITVSLLKPTLQIADRFDYVFNQYKKIAGGEFVGFSNASYLSQRESADRNYALGYFMREKKCFPDETDLMKTLEFYFQLSCVEMTTASASVIAATLANGGICPLTGERLLAGEAVRNTLSLMYSCGMYDYSGQFAFKVGLPAKASRGGALLIVIPNVMGVCVWSPPLDKMGNSARGVQFCEELVDMFNFHNYDDYDDLSCIQKKIDPRKHSLDIEANRVVNLLFGAANGDVTAIRRFKLTGMDMTMTDYDGRTALHLAAAEGHLSVVRMLLEQCRIPMDPKDRWRDFYGRMLGIVDGTATKAPPPKPTVGLFIKYTTLGFLLFSRYGFTPLDDAKKFGHEDIVNYLEELQRNLQSGVVPPTPRSRGGSIEWATSKTSPAEPFSSVTADMKSLSFKC